jgi:hypothetical protein
MGLRVLGFPAAVILFHGNIPEYTEERRSRLLTEAIRAHRGPLSALNSIVETVVPAPEPGNFSRRFYSAAFSS